VRLWDIFYYDLLLMSFESRYELRHWCNARLHWRKAGEEKRLAQEAELKRRRAREADAGGMTSETWPPP
jgi:hypothetical protein